MSTRVKYVTNVVPGFLGAANRGRRMLRTLETETRDLFMNVEKSAAAETRPASWPLEPRSARSHGIMSAMPCR